MFNPSLPGRGQYVFTKEGILHVLTFRNPETGRLGVIKDLSKDYLMKFTVGLKEKIVDECRRQDPTN